MNARLIQVLVVTKASASNSEAVLELSTDPSYRGKLRNALDATTSALKSKTHSHALHVYGAAGWPSGAFAGRRGLREITSDKEPKGPSRALGYSLALVATVVQEIVEIVEPGAVGSAGSTVAWGATGEFENGAFKTPGDLDKKAGFAEEADTFIVPNGTQVEHPRLVPVVGSDDLVRLVLEEASAQIERYVRSGTRGEKSERTGAHEELRTTLLKAARLPYKNATDPLGKAGARFDRALASLDDDPSGRCRLGLALLLSGLLVLVLASALDLCGGTAPSQMPDASVSDAGWATPDVERHDGGVEQVERDAGRSRRTRKPRPGSVMLDAVTEGRRPEPCVYSIVGRKGMDGVPCGEAVSVPAGEYDVEVTLPELSSYDRRPWRKKITVRAGHSKSLVIRKKFVRLNAANVEGDVYINGNEAHGPFNHSFWSPIHVRVETSTKPSAFVFAEPTTKRIGGLLVTVEHR